jgi:hypothetical protein
MAPGAAPGVPADHVDPGRHRLGVDPDKELITTIGVKSIITQPNDVGRGAVVVELVVVPAVRLLSTTSSLVSHLTDQLPDQPGTTGGNPARAERPPVTASRVCG